MATLDATTTTWEIRWEATGAGRDRRTRAWIITVCPVDEHHALLEGWQVTGDRERAFLPRQLVPCRRLRDDDLVHLDALLDGAAVLALTLRGDELLYARTSLLADAGVQPGACNPPACRRRTRRDDAASA